MVLLSKTMEGEFDSGLIAGLERAGREAASTRQIFGAAVAPNVQIDLNDATQIGDLEDAGLIEHMAAARAQLAAQERAGATLPPAESLIQADIEGRRALSSLSALLREQRMALSCVRDTVMLQSSNAEKIASGVKPHGFPAPDGGRNPAQLTFLSARISASGADLERICAAIEAAECELTRARRSIEAATVGLCQRSTHYEQAWIALGATVRD